MSNPPVPDLGAIIDGRYELVSIIGEGGFGVVYRARQLSTNQDVAVKVMLTSGHASESRREAEIVRFKREMTLIGKLRHPHIVRLIDSGELDTGALYMVLEFVEGVPLSGWLEERGPMAPASAAHLMGQVVDALHYAHSKGVVHRDLKPHNIMVTEAGFRPTVTVLDFGIAGVLESARGTDYQGVTKTHDALGTPAYMAPEQITNDDIGPETDLYAWGLIFVECLTGRGVANGTSVMQILFEQATRERVELPPSLAAHPLGPVVERATLKSRENRFHTAAEVIEALEAIPRAELGDVVLPIEQPGNPAVMATMETMAGDVAAPATARNPAGGGETPRGERTAAASPGAKQAAPPQVVEPAPSGSTAEASGAAPAPSAPEHHAVPPPQRSGGSAGLGMLLGGVAVVGLIVAVVVIASSGADDAGETADAEPEATTGERAEATGAAATSASDPEPDAGESAAGEPGAPAHPFGVADLPAATVQIGLSDAERAELSAVHGDAFEIDLSAHVGTLPAIAWERPALRVSTHEITWGEWWDTAASRPDLLSGAASCPEAPLTEPDPGAGGHRGLAVTGVTPSEAEAFCAAWDMRLPTAREWEAIARGPRGLRHGSEGPLDDARLAALAAQERPAALAWNQTPEGIYDVAGSVSEWVRCGDDGLAYCLEGYGHRGGASGADPFFLESAVMMPPLQGTSSRCHRGESIGFRCVAGAAE